MNFRTKQAVDFWLGGALLLSLILPVRALGILMRRNHAIDQRRGCAVIKLVGAGSLFLAMPSLAAIRARFPAGRFCLVGTAAVIGFAKPFGWFDEYWEIDDSSIPRLIWSSLRTLARLARHTDHLIDLEVHSRLTTVFSVLSTVRNRIGFVNDIVSWRRAFYTHMTYFNVQGPVYAFYDLLADWFGVKQVAVRAFHGGFREAVLTAALPDDVALPSRYIAVGPGCSDLSRERQLRPEEWQRLVPRAGDSPAIVLLGALSDAPLAGQVATALGGGYNLCGKLTFRQSARVLAGAQRYYGIDSLLLHIARALGVPSVSVWGPSKPATLMRPNAAADTVYFAQMACSPCIHVHETPPCRGLRPCIPAAMAGAPHPMAQIAPDDVGMAAGWASDPSGQVRLVRVAYD